MSEELCFEGCNFFRLRICYSILSGRRIKIRNIRKNEDAPGIRDYESKLLNLIDRITNGTRIEIGATGTMVTIRPGLIIGGNVTFDCGSSRCLSYFLEPLVMISPFCKNPLVAKLKGVTNAPDELSVDAIKGTWFSVYNKFVLNDEKLDLKISARGLMPDGGGSIIFTAPIVKTLRSPKREKAGKVCKIRGYAYVSKVTPSVAYRMITEAKKTLTGYIADVYITVDHRKGDGGGKSPGYGLFLTAETTEGVVYHGEAISRPKGVEGDPLTAEEIGNQAAVALLNQIHAGGSLDSSAQSLAATFVTLCQKDVSKFLFGPFTVYSVNCLRHLKKFFEVQFKIEEWRKIVTEEQESLAMGSLNKSMVTGMGIGYSNLNKLVL
ncbi:unnamed protein product [Auanema sp. JU1783]|nr:unnamed protein product [Auanema sp. JU1783]